MAKEEPACAQPVIVVGGGIAGLAATLELLEQGCSVILLEKQASLGGNASKATCGIAAPGNWLQREEYLPDGGRDMLSDGSLTPGLVKEGTKDVEWFLELVGAKDEMVLREMPGHPVRRVLGSKLQFPGAVIMRPAILLLRQIAAHSPGRLRLVTCAHVRRLLFSDEKVAGVEYERNEELRTVSGPVLLATGGYCGERSESSLLAQYAPAALKLPTTNDTRSSGDGLHLASAVGAGVEKMDRVLAVPNAVRVGNPDCLGDPFAVVVSDALFGAGARLYCGSGRRFVDERAPSGVRVDAMCMAPGPFRLCLAATKAEPVAWLVDFYLSRGILRRYAHVNDLAAEMGVYREHLGELEAGEGAVFVAELEPALLASLGGLSTGRQPRAAGRVLTHVGRPIEGLFAAGELVAAASETAWSLTGVPLLQCIHSGRAAGRAAAESLGVDRLRRTSALELGCTCCRPQAGSPTSPARPAEFTADQVARHKTDKDAWVVINGQAYDVTNWMRANPAAAAVLERYLGKDASEVWPSIQGATTLGGRGVDGPYGPVNLGPVAGARRRRGQPVTCDALKPLMFFIRQILRSHPGCPRI